MTVNGGCAPVDKSLGCISDDLSLNRLAVGFWLNDDLHDPCTRHKKTLVLSASSVGTVRTKFHVSFDRG
jgi:hypothetical protein